MATQFTIPIGEIKELIDIWDQPPDPDVTDGSKVPDVLFASDVWAKIEDLWSTAQPEKLAGQVLTEASHRIYIHWLPGVKSRMYIVWHHADGDKRLDIAQPPGDPDGNHQYMRILAIQRNDEQ